MRQWRGSVLTVVVTLLVVVLCILGNSQLNKVPSPEAQAVADLQKRVESLSVLKAEQTLTRDIMLIQLEIKELQLKAQAPPVIKGEFIPTDKLPEDMK